MLRDVSNQDLGLDFKFVDKVAIYENELISILLPETIFSREEIEKLINFFNAASTDNLSSDALIDFDEKDQQQKSKTVEKIEEAPKQKPKKAVTAATKKTKTAAKPKATKAKTTASKRKKTTNDKK